VIGVDSGLSHIAVALDLPHVQIYNFDTAWRTGPQLTDGPTQARVAARQVSLFAQPTPSVDSVWLTWNAVLAADQAAKQVSRFRPSGVGGL
jgi:heptosyltransferase-1